MCVICEYNICIHVYKCICAHVCGVCLHACLYVCVHVCMHMFVCDVYRFTYVG